MSLSQMIVPSHVQNFIKLNYFTFPFNFNYKLIEEYQFCFTIAEKRNKGQEQILFVLTYMQYTTFTVQPVLHKYKEIKLSFLNK